MKPAETSAGRLHRSSTLSRAVRQLGSWRLAAPLGILPMLFSPAAWAQTELQEVLVSATKRGEQNVQDVPISITVITQEKIEQTGMDDLLDYARTVPGIGFKITSPAGGRGDLRGGRRIAIRGIESGPDGIPTTAFYLDDAPVPIMDPRLFDINRIEVLRGPQGTLYGANSMGGTIRVVMNRPEFDVLDYRADVAVGSTSKSSEEVFRVNGMLNVPLVEDKVALRGVVSYRDEGGFIDNVPEVFPNATRVDTDRGINGEETWGARFAVAFRPTERLLITPSVFRQDIKIDDTPQFEESFRDLGYFNKLVRAWQENNFTLYGLEISYDLGSWQVFSSTTYFESEFLSVDDFTKSYLNWGIPLVPGMGGRGLQDIRSERTSQELRFTYTGSERWNGVFGVFFMAEDRFFRQHLPNDGNFPDFPPPTLMFTGSEDASDDQIAVFGEATFSLTDRLSLTAGARWFDGEQDQVTIFDGVLNGGPSEVAGEASDSSVSPKVQLNFQPTDGHMVYAAAAKGFRPGGPTNLVPSACDEDLLELGLSEPLSEYKADELWNYELGFKSAFAGNRLMVNASAYFMDWKDVQQSVRLACGFGFVGNVGAAESKGLELEVSAVPNDDWELSFSLGYTNAEFTKTSEEVGVVSGDRIPNVPELTGSATAQYNFQAFNGREAYVRGDYQYVDRIVADQAAGPGLQFRPSYDLLNLRFGVALTDNVEFIVFGDNVLDERPVLSIDHGLSSVPDMSRDITTSRPRTYGIKLSYAMGGR